MSSYMCDIYRSKKCFSQQGSQTVLTHVLEEAFWNYNGLSLITTRMHFWGQNDRINRKLQTTNPCESLECTSVESKQQINDIITSFSEHTSFNMLNFYCDACMVRVVFKMVICKSSLRMTFELICRLFLIYRWDVLMEASFKTQANER